MATSAGHVVGLWGMQGRKDGGRQEKREREGEGERMRVMYTKQKTDKTKNRKRGKKCISDKIATSSRCCRTDIYSAQDAEQATLEQT